MNPTNNSKGFLELEVIWKDNDMIELEITATNADFSGSIKAYASPPELLNFAKALKGFPINVNAKPVLYEGIQGYSFFSMMFYCFDKAGNVAVQLVMEQDILSGSTIREKNKMRIEIMTEPNAIDTFQKELEHIAEDWSGKAILNERRS